MRQGQAHAAAGLRMLTRCSSWLIGAAIVAAAQLLVAPIRAQTPDYRLDSSGLQVISLFNLSPGECFATSISGRIVKREFDARGVVPSGVSVEVPSGERSFINIDQYALAQLSNVARSWIITSLQTLLNEGREVTLGIKLCGAGGRVAYLDAVAAPSTPPIPSRSPNAIGPSFDCGTKAVAEQPLAQMICANRELAYWELSYVIAYQALREAAIPDQRKAMVAEANALVVALNDRCDLPRSGALQRPPTDQEVNCIKALFQQEKRTLVERAMGMAREEALLEPADTIAIQKALQAQSYLSRTDAVDGVFGPERLFLLGSGTMPFAIPALPRRGCFSSLPLSAGKAPRQLHRRRIRPQHRLNSAIDLRSAQIGLARPTRYG
jgi:hypothetical protein